MGSIDWSGIGGLVVIVLGAIGGLVGTIVTVITKSRQQKNNDSIQEYQKIVEAMRVQHADDKAELKKQFAGAMSQIEQKQEAIDELYEMQTDCEIGHAELYAWAQGAYLVMKRQEAKLTLAGKEPDAVPELPPQRHRRTARAGYVQRRAEQNTVISIANAKSIIGEAPSPKTTEPQP